MYKDQNPVTKKNKRIKHKPTHYNDKRRKHLFLLGPFLSLYFIFNFFITTFFSLGDIENNSPVLMYVCLESKP